MSVWSLTWLLPTLLYITGASMLAMVGVMLRKRNVRGAFPFAVFSLCAAIYAIFYGLELQSPTLERALFYNKIQYIGLAGIPAAATIFAFALTGVQPRIPCPIRTLILIVPVLTAVFRWTNEQHGWVYRAVEPVAYRGLMVLHISGGWWYAVFVLFLNATIVLVLGTVFATWRGAHLVLRRQLRLLALGALFPWMGHLFYQALSVRGPMFDLSPFGFSLAAIVWSTAVLRYGLLDLSPVARHMVFNSIQEGVLVLDMQNRLVDLNPAAAKMLNIDAERSIGAPIEKLLAGMPALANCVRAEDPVVEVAADRSIYHVKFNKLRSSSGNPYGKVMLISDVTEQRCTEEQLRHAQKMESIGRLAGGMAHDFNSMLQAILGFSELAQLELSEDHPAYSHLREIESAARHSAGITKQLLTFARRRAAQAGTLDLGQAVATQVKMLKRLVGESIEFIYREPMGPLPLIRLDEGNVEQILANLVVNARDAIKEFGTISVEVRETILDEDYCRARGDAKPGRYVMLSVNDNGCGMPNEVRAHLFEPFFTTKDPGRGTGLGLATVYGIVRQHGGFIHVYSEVGKGSAFKLYFPAVGSESRVIEKKLPAEVVGGNETVLFVEDEEAIRNLGKSVLERFGYRVYVATCPDDALKLIESVDGPIHALVTDVIMPGMNGRELARILKKRWPELRVIFMSGYTADILDPSLAAQGRFRYLQKPFAGLALAAEVRTALDEPAEKSPAMETTA